MATSKSSAAKSVAKASPKSAAKTAGVSLEDLQAVLAAQPVIASNAGINFGTQADVDAAINSGAFVVGYRCNFKKDSVLGPNTPMNSFGGGLSVTNDMSRAFMSVRTMAHSLNSKTQEKEYIAPGTTIAYYLDASQEDLQAANTLFEKFPVEAAKVLTALQAKKKEMNLDYDAWQSLFASMDVSGEASLYFNSPHWNAEFCQTMAAMSAAGQVKSFTMYFVLQDAVASDHGVIFKPKNGATPVYGRKIYIEPIFVEFSDQVIRSSVKGIKIEASKINEAFTDLIALKADAMKVNPLQQQHQQLAAAKYGKKAIANALEVFEAGLAEGKWNRNVEATLREIAASGYFNKQKSADFYCTLAANNYFSSKEAEFDGEYIALEVNVKAQATEIKTSSRALSI